MHPARKASIVVPVCNEAAVLAQTVPSLLKSAREIDAQVLWVCNGCTDDSAQMLHGLLTEASDASVLEIEERSKTIALQAGDDRLGGLFPRFYIDADTWLCAGDLTQLYTALSEGEADLVGPGQAFDCAGASRISAAIARCWLALPFGGSTAILGVVGVSSAGRACWGAWPRVLGDDIFVNAVVPAARARQVPCTCATSPAPADFPAWVQRRARWRAGERQLRAMGLSFPFLPDQRAALLSRLIGGPERAGALAFIAARLIAGLRRTQFVDGWEPGRRRR